MKIATKFTLTATSILFLGCATYRIPVNSFDEQTRKIGSSTLRTQKIMLSIYGTHTFQVNPIDSIDVETEGGKKMRIKNGPSIETRFTKLDDSTRILYFDSIYRKDSLIIGSRARLISMYDTIPISQIKMIEIQDGKKRYSYVY